MKRLAVRAALLGLMSSVVLAIGGPASADPSDEFARYITAQDLKFYPTVFDGYRDRTRVEVDNNNYDYSRLRADIIQLASGRKVRDMAPGYRYVGDDIGYQTFNWNGKNNNDRLVKPGRYRMVITADAYDVETDTYAPVKATYPLSILKGTKVRTFRKELRGTATSSRRIGRGCYTSASAGTLEMGCWQGTRVSASWAYNIPRNAFDVKPLAYGPSGYNYGGQYRFFGKRLSKTRYVATAEVTKWRSELFDSVDLKWKAKVKV